MATTKNKFPSELRYDLVGQDWVLIATGRAKKPELYKREAVAGERLAVKRDQCPFCNIEGQEKPVLAFNK